MMFGLIYAIQFIALVVSVQAAPTANSTSLLSINAVSSNISNANITESGNTTVPTNCSLIPKNTTLYSTIKRVLSEGVTMIEFSLKFRGQDELPASISGKGTSKMFKPNFWVKTTGRFGTRLLLLKPNYDVMSFKSLELKVKKFKEIELLEEPANCLNDLTYDDIERKLRDLVLNNFHTTTAGQVEQEDVTESVCNVHIRDISGADFTYYCCNKVEGKKNLTCDYLASDIWFDLMRYVIRLVKLIFILFCPLLLPVSIFSYMDDRDSFLYKLESPFKISLLLNTRASRPRLLSRPVSSTNSDEIHVRLSNIKHMKRFTDLVQDLPLNVSKDYTITEAELQTGQGRVISPGEAPTRIFQTLYEFLVNCRIREMKSVKECCRANICKKIPIMYTWFQCSKAFMRLVVALALIAPWIIRMVVYYRYEHKEMTLRKQAAHEKGYSFQFQGNFALYLTPLHAVFIFTYIFLAVECIIYGNMNKRTKETFKFIFRQCFLDMNADSRTKAFGGFVQLLLIPFTSLGCWVIFGGVFMWLILIPIALVFFAFYMFPTINLTIRLLAHVVVYALPSRLLHSPDSAGETQGEDQTEDIDGEDADNIDEDVEEDDFSDGPENQIHGGTKTLFRRIKKGVRPHNFELRNMVHKISVIRNDKALGTCHGRVVQVIVVLFCLITLYSILLLLFEMVTFFLDVFIYTLIGFILYADFTMTYISLAVLLLVYGKDCFGSVSQRYREFSSTINRYMLIKCEKQALPEFFRDESRQQNRAFLVKPCEGEEDPCEAENRIWPDHREVRMVNDKSRYLYWRVRKVAFFLTKNDIPKIPTKLLFNASTMSYPQSPGRLLHQYLIASMHFAWIVAFLLFVLLVVMTFGETGKISASNQLLATIAGGILPFLLRNFIFRSYESHAINPDKDINFRVAIHDLLNNFRQDWLVHDINAMPTDTEASGTRTNANHTTLVNVTETNDSVANTNINATTGAVDQQETVLDNNTITDTVVTNIDGNHHDSATNNDNDAEPVTGEHTNSTNNDSTTGSQVASPGNSTNENNVAAVNGHVNRVSRTSTEQTTDDKITKIVIDLYLSDVDKYDMPKLYEKLKTNKSVQNATDDDGSPKMSLMDYTEDV